MDGWRRRDLWSPLAVAEANAMLRDGAYGLRVEPAPWRLTGPGAGVGLPLGDEPTWGDLYRALVRLRRTRRTHDPAWLHRLTRTLSGEVPAAGATRWVVVPPGRLERLTAGCGTDLRHFLAPLVASDGSTLFPATGGGVERPDLVVDDNGGVITVRGEAGPPVRLRATDLGAARSQLSNWSALAAAVESDPVLRMHCAAQAVPGALADADSALLLQGIEPSPRHPGHPGGTVVAGLPALLRPTAGGRAGLLRMVIENRFEHREDELGYFLDHLVRPLLRTFRLALDDHRLALLSLDPDGAGFELSTELQLTGRAVVTDLGEVRPEPTGAEVTAAADGLTRTLDELTAGFAAIGFAGGRHRHEAVRAAVEEVTAEELRFLRPRTAELLSGDHGLRDFAHSVPEDQDRVLKEVLRVVEERTRKRRWDRDLPQPVVVIDLDMCGIVPLRRTLDAARAVCGPRPGAPEGIIELARPGSLPVLPNFSESAWDNFVDLSGLGRKYPAVDWRQVHAEFFHAFSRPWERLRTDTVSPGLARFVWDVHDGGGRVVFCTGRRERVRAQTEEVLAAAGVPEAALLCMPDDRTRPISELKAEKLRELGDIDVVAVFDDLLRNRVALTGEFAGARAVAVEIPGMATERRPGQQAGDQAPVISTFETIPRRAAPSLSNTHSLEELQIGAMRRNRLSRDWAVHLSERETLSLVGSVLADADRSAARTARGARVKFGLDQGEPGFEQVIRALHHVFTRKQFLKGSRSNYRWEDMLRDAGPFVSRDQPLEIVLLGFPVKQCLNRLKAFGPLPDLAELGGLARLRELRNAVRAVHPPGVHFNILTDGRHFRPRPAAITDAYSRKLREYVRLVGIDDCTTVEEIDTVARQRLGPDLPARRSARLARYRAEIYQVLQGFDITANPLRTLDEVDQRVSRMDGELGEAMRLFREMLMSVVYSVPVTAPAGVDRLTWSTLVYADLYNPADPAVPEQVRRARAAVLSRAWHTVVRYVATLRVDEALGYEDLFPDRVRLTVSAARPGRCGFTYLGGSGLLPWQGTGVLDPRGHVAVDFAIAVLDQGFVPVYSPLLGPRQPWMMVPAQHTRPSASGGLRLDDALAERVRLRRK
ncbi:L-tyrosine/L-tryptophan isonitrile synthase family protein [Saccharopolyspora erythraea]|uniref:L-tyrosine/L-tryptophan isonitrile synthase family protein n=1 Tax=Saccharopolyspora erythraea TaxID=1836 RepID=UPI001BA48767|nr:L-tyrosine/L-tryptophan isonitrile synthase family protein [Saccharopolyspora erythraea]QUG99451.1 L-tyrosine/L-tryptophan isonitrile synthase family protein [Saccharopolyspora erythraea]